MSPDPEPLTVSGGSAGARAPVDPEALLACPRCHGPLSRAGSHLACRASDCGGRLVMRDGVVEAVSGTPDVFFDDHHAVMLDAYRDAGVWDLFHACQGGWLADIVRPAAVVLDVGCGPAQLYARPAAGVLLGLDLSFASLRPNQTLDLAIHGSVTAMPLPARSVDVVVANYMLHHLVGDSLDANRQLLAAAFAEFARVLRPGGSLVVCETCLRWLGWRLEQLAWNPVRRLIGRRPFVHFWARPALVAAGTVLPPGTRLDYRRVDLPWYRALRPIFVLPWLRIPRGLYPFEVGMYHWTLPGPGLAPARSDS